MAGAALLLLLALDAMTHTSNQNPTVTTAVYGPLEIEKTVHAHFGESRAMLHPWLQQFMANAATPDPVADYLGQRRTLHFNANLIDDIPTTSGFFSLELGTSAPVTSLLNELGHDVPEPLVDFVGASQISAPDTSFNWISRTNYLPLATAGQKPIFAINEETLKALASPNFEPRSIVYLPEEAREIVTATNQSATQVSPREFSGERAGTRCDRRRADAGGGGAGVVCAVARLRGRRAGEAVAGQRRVPGAGSAGRPSRSHDVRDEDNLFELGLVISLASLIGAGAIWRAAGKRGRQRVFRR